MANTDRAALQTALKYHTDNKLTNATDQNFYLNKSEQDVFADWRKFDPGLFRPALETITADANGVILLTQTFTRLEYLEDTNHRQYFVIPNMASVPFGTGYIFLGYDQTNNKRQIKVLLNGVAVASGTTLQWYNIERMQMGAATNAESAIPEEHRALISIRAAFLYFRDKGPAFMQFKDSWNGEYEGGLRKAKDWYKNISKDPQFVQTYDPDAGNSRQRLQNYLT